MKHIQSCKIHSWLAYTERNLLFFYIENRQMQCLNATSYDQSKLSYSFLRTKNLTYQLFLSGGTMFHLIVVNLILT